MPLPDVPMPAVVAARPRDPVPGSPQRAAGSAGTGAGLSADRGHRRGEGGAVCGFTSVEFHYVDTVLFRFAGLVEFLPHDLGAAQRAALAREIAQEDRHPPAAPPYLLADEDAALERMVAYVDGRLPDH